MERFTTWATTGGCATAIVDSYAGNAGAQQLYEGLGFTVQSVTRVRSLG